MINAAFKRYIFPTFTVNTFLAFQFEGTLTVSSPGRGGCAHPSPSHKRKAICWSTHWLLTLWYIVLGHLALPAPLAWRRTGLGATEVTTLAGRHLTNAPCEFLFPFQLLCYSKKSHSHTGDSIYYRWTWPSESRSALYQHLRITTLGQAFPKSHRSSPGSYHRFLTCCISYKWVYSSTVTDWAIIHISQPTKEQPPWQTQSILGTACKIPTLDAISRWARTHRSAEDGKSTANNLHAWKLSS